MYKFQLKHGCKQQPWVYTYGKSLKTDNISTLEKMVTNERTNERTDERTNILSDNVTS